MGSPPQPAWPGASARGGQDWAKPKRRPRKGGGNASRPTPTKVGRNPASRGPSQPRLFKATAESAHHLVSPSPSLKHKIPTTHLLSFVKPPPGITFGVAATATRHAEYRGGLRGVTPQFPKTYPRPESRPLTQMMPGAIGVRRCPTGVGAAGSRWSPAARATSDRARRDVLGRPGASRPGPPLPIPRKKSWQH